MENATGDQGEEMRLMNQDLEQVMSPFSHPEAGPFFLFFLHPSEVRTFLKSKAII